MGRYIFNDVFKEIVDTYYIDSTVLGAMIDRDSSRIRHYKIDSKPGKVALEKLINTISDKILVANDIYTNTVLMEKINQIISSNKSFTDDIRTQLYEIKDIAFYVPFVLRRSLEFSTEPVKTPDKPESLASRNQSIITKVSQAHQYFINNLYDDALRIYNEIKEDPKSSGLIQQSLTLHTDLGLIYRTNGLSTINIDMMKMAIFHFDIAAKVSSEAEDFINNALAYKYLATVYVLLSDFEEAESNLIKAAEYNDIALSLFIDRDQEEYSRVQINYGILFMRYSNIRNTRNLLKNAISYFEKAIDYFGQNSNNYFKALACLQCSCAYCSLSYIYNTQANSKRALDMIEQALKTFTLEDYPWMYAQCISSLGYIHATLAEYNDTIVNCNKAIDYINQALSILAEKIDAYSNWIANINLSATYIVLSNHTKNYDYMEKAAAYIENCQQCNELQKNSINHVKVNLMHAEALINIAEAKKDKLLFEEAEKILHTSIEAAKKNNNDYLVALTDSTKAKLYFAKYQVTNDIGLLDYVMDLSNQALETLTINDYPLSYALLTHLKAKVYRLKQNYDMSRYSYESVLRIFTQDKYPDKYIQVNSEYTDLRETDNK